MLCGASLALAPCIEHVQRQHDPQKLSGCAMTQHDPTTSSQPARPSGDGKAGARAAAAALAAAWVVQRRGRPCLVELPEVAGQDPAVELLLQRRHAHAKDALPLGRQALLDVLDHAAAPAKDRRRCCECGAPDPQQSTERGSCWQPPGRDGMHGTRAARVQGLTATGAGAACCAAGSPAQRQRACSGVKTWWLRTAKATAGWRSTSQARGSSCRASETAAWPPSVLSPSPAPDRPTDAGGCPRRTAPRRKAITARPPHAGRGAEPPELPTDRLTDSGLLMSYCASKTSASGKRSGWRKASRAHSSRRLFCHGDGRPGEHRKAVLLPVLLPSRAGRGEGGRKGQQGPTAPAGFLPGLTGARTMAGPHPPPRLPPSAET